MDICKNRNNPRIDMDEMTSRADRSIFLIFQRDFPLSRKPDYKKELIERMRRKLKGLQAFYRFYLSLSSIAHLTQKNDRTAERQEYHIHNRDIQKDEYHSVKL